MKITITVALLLVASMASAHIMRTDSKVASLMSEKTATGIPLDTAWKKKLNTFALKNVVHPAWGYTHSERNYHNTIKIAQAEGQLVDEDVLFAAAFLHDLGGLENFEIPGVDHGVRSAELAEQLLKSFGFPEEKISLVKEVIIGHVYSQPKPKSELALVFREADIIDFLGTLGIARLLAATNELGSTPKGSIHQSLEVAKKLRDQLPKQLGFEISKKMAQKRIKEGDQLLKLLERDSFGGLAY